MFSCLVFSQTILAHFSRLSDSISYDDANSILFASFKYVGNDWDRDMKAMAANAKVREWWEMTDKMQKSPVPGATGSATGPWWKPLEEVFYCA